MVVAAMVLLAGAYCALKFFSAGERKSGEARREPPVEAAAEPGGKPRPQPGGCVDWRWEPDGDAIRSREMRPPVELRRRGLPGVADACLARGEGRRAFALLGRAARKRPEFYRDIADAFANGRGDRPDARMASHYDRLADQREKAQAELLRRSRRRAAERRRDVLLLRAAA